MAEKDKIINIYVANNRVSALVIAFLLAKTSFLIVSFSETNIPFRYLIVSIIGTEFLKLV